MTGNTLEQSAAAKEMWIAALSAAGQTTRAAALTAGWQLDIIDSIAISTIEAALRLSAGADWQPIETAPRDRTDILIAGGTYSVRDYPDLKFSGVGIAFWDRDHWHGNEDNAHDEWCRHHPTHWQPLPAAPRHEPGESRV